MKNLSRLDWRCQLIGAMRLVQPCRLPVQDAGGPCLASESSRARDQFLLCGEHQWQQNLGRNPAACHGAIRAKNWVQQPETEDDCPELWIIKNCLRGRVCEEELVMMTHTVSNLSSKIEFSLSNGYSCC